MKNNIIVIFIIISILISFCYCDDKKSNVIREEIYFSIELLPNSRRDSDFYRSIIQIKLYNNTTSNYCIPNAGLNGLITYLDSSGNDISRKIELFEEEYVLTRHSELESNTSGKFYTWNWISESNKDQTFREYSNEQKGKAIYYEIATYIRNNKTNCRHLDTSFMNYLLNEKYFYSIFIPKNDSIYIHSETLIPTNIKLPITCFIKLHSPKQDSIILSVPQLSIQDSCLVNYYLEPLNKLHDNYITISNILISDSLFINWWK